MKKYLIVLVPLLLIATPLQAGGRRMGEQPAPRLLAPGDAVRLADNGPVEFRWSEEGDRASRDYYDFRLYRGPKTIESALILKEKVPANEPYLRVESKIFSENEIYSWSVRQIGSKKSRSEYSIFKCKRLTSLG